jgi:DNA-binding LytR/AlgR family response regulator
MKLNCIIVDDEPAARNGLAEDIKDIGFITVCGLAANAFEALDLINKLSPDLIFLDVDMPVLSGLDFLRLIKVKPMVVITTAYPQYALDGYDHGVVDYLLKPISLERLAIACDKALQLHSYRNQSLSENIPPGHFFIKCNGKMERIDFNEILYIEAANNYIFIHTNSKRYMVYRTLKGIAGQLPQNKFVRVHKSFIVARDQIQQVSADEIVVNNVNIPLSRNFKSNFQKQIFLSKPTRHG